MENLTLRAHFDGTQILLDDLVELQPNATLLVTVLEPQAEDDAAWYELAVQNLANAYSDDEPEYQLTMVKKFCLKSTSRGLKTHV